MIYGRLKIEEAISLKKKCTVAFVDSLPYETQHGLMELIMKIEIEDLLELLGLI